MTHDASNSPLLISFSGVDGSGKSTQIDGLRTALHAAGLKTTLLAFWDNVVVGVKYREGFVHKVYKSERGIGAPGKPVNSGPPFPLPAGRYPPVPCGGPRKKERSGRRDPGPLYL